MSKEVVFKRYTWPARFVTPQDGIGDALRAWRRDAVRDREIFLGLKKQFGRDDRDAARFFKDNASYHLRLERACKLALPWLGEPDANQEPISPELWPVELAPEMNEIARRIMLTFG